MKSLKGKEWVIISNDLYVAVTWVVRGIHSCRRHVSWISLNRDKVKILVELKYLILTNLIRKIVQNPGIKFVSRVNNYSVDHDKLVSALSNSAHPLPVQFRFQHPLPVLWLNRKKFHFSKKWNQKRQNPMFIMQISTLSQVTLITVANHKTLHRNLKRIKATWLRQSNFKNDLKLKNWKRKKK